MRRRSSGSGRRDTNRRLSGFTIELTFADGSCATLDMEPWIGPGGGVFEPLKDPAFLALVAVDPETGTIGWPNDVGLDPDVLCEVARGWIPVPQPGREIHLPGRES